MSAPAPTPSSPKPAPTDTPQDQSVAPSAPDVSADTTAKAPDTQTGSTEPAAATSTTTPSPVTNEKGEHILETPWTFWYDHKLPKSTTTPQIYAEHLKKLGTFTTVEGFYRMYVNLMRPVDLPKDSNYHLFRNEVTPMWENFPNGGCWILKVKRKEPAMGLGRLWEQLLVASIGEIFEEPKIVGVVLSTRNKADVLAVWNSDGQNQSLIHRISDKLRIILNLDRTIPIEYKSNMTSMKDKSTYRNGKLVVSKDKKKKKKKGHAAAIAADAKHDEKNNSNASDTHEKADGTNKATGGNSAPAEQSNTATATPAVAAPAGAEVKA